MKSGAQTMRHMDTINGDRRLRHFAAGALVALALAGAVFAQATHELRSLGLTLLDDHTMLAVDFVSTPPEDFLVYLITEQATPVLVVEFMDASWLGDMFVKLEKPVGKVQMLHDTLDTRLSARILVSLESNVPYRYRWQGNAFELELLWGEADVARAQPFHLLDIQCSVDRDSTAQFVFLFDREGVEYALAAPSGTGGALVTFANTVAHDDLAAKKLPPAIDSVKTGDAPKGGTPVVKVAMRSTATLSGTDDRREAKRVVVALHSGASAVASAQEPSDTQQAAASDSAEQARGGPLSRFLQTKAHRRWTYIGVGGGILVGGAVLGAILSGKKEDTPTGASDGSIPDIEDVVNFPPE